MRIFLSTAAAALLCAAPALADDAAQCSAGIARIKADIASTPAKPVLTKLQAALRVAERELKEREFDECLDAVKDADRAMKR